MHKAADRIRNVALIGHRGSGKTSLNEALLYHAGQISRMGTVLDGTTVSDADPDEKSRKLSISTSLASLQWHERRVNLLDTPGEPSFVADTLAALRVCESAIFVVSAVTGVEPQIVRLWQRASDFGLARLVFVNMLDRERADFYTVLDALKAAFGPHVVATEIPMGGESAVQGVIDLVDMRALRFAGSSRENCTEIDIPEEFREQAETYHEKLMDEVAENSDALMERYLDGDDIAHEEVVAALKQGTNDGSLVPVTCGIAIRNMGTERLLDAIVDDLPSPVLHGGLKVGERELSVDDSGQTVAYVFKTRADAFAGRVNLFRVYSGVVRHDSQLINTRVHVKERIGQLISFGGSGQDHVEELGAGDIGAVAKLKETRSGDWLSTVDEPIEMAGPRLPLPVMAFALEVASGDEEKIFTALRRLQEEDPTIDLHRDPQTGEQIIAGLSQLHVEVLVDRLRSRFGLDVTLQPPRVPYRETIRGTAKAHGRHKKQTGGHGQFADCRIEIEPLAAGAGFQFVDSIKGGVIPSGFIPAVEKGVRDAMRTGAVAGYPVSDVKVTVFDGAFHPVDSSEMAFKLASSAAMRDALADAQPVLLEPVMMVTITVPEETVGDVIGDLNSRRGHPHGMEPAAGGMTAVKAEVPMAEMLGYAPDLRAITAGQGEYTMELLRYDPVPSHLIAEIAARSRAEPVKA
jgi:elongation factor G